MPYPSSDKEYVKKKRQEHKNNALIALGGKCVKCGFNDFRALQIDHVNGFGAADKRENGYSGQTYYKNVTKSYNKGFGKYQLLCANCNWIKRFERGEHKNSGVLKNCNGEYFLSK